MTEFWFDADTDGQQTTQAALAMQLEQTQPAVAALPELIVAPEPPAFDIQTLRQQAEALAADLGRKPRKPDYIEAARQGKVARYVTIQELVGGVTALNEAIGFPDYSSWGGEEFIAYGIDFAEVNGIGLLVPDIMDIVARRGRGPWGRSAAIRFGTWGAYKEEINTALRLTIAAETERAEKLAEYAALLALGQLPAYMKGLNDDELLCAVGKYYVVNDCAADAAPGIKHKLISRRPQSFVKGIRDHRPELSQGYIEMVAVSHGVFNDIWPPAAAERLVLPEHIRVSETEVAEVRARRIAADRKRQPRPGAEAA